MAHIKSMEIYQFRGIQQLIVSDFSRINLIVGDNNCGKLRFWRQFNYCLRRHR